MALSGTVISTKDTQYDMECWIKLTWSATQDIAENKSILSWRLTFCTNKGSGWLRAIRSAKATINSVVVANIGETHDLNNGSSLSSGSNFIIDHNDDGTKTFTISIEFTATGSASSKQTGSGTFSLNPIARNPCVYVWANSKWNKGKPYTYYNKEGTNLGWVQARGKQIFNSDTIEGVAVWVDDPDNPENSGWKTTVTKG